VRCEAGGEDDHDLLGRVFVPPVLRRR
jgi:hypothetical protein